MTKYITLMQNKKAKKKTKQPKLGYINRQHGLADIKKNEEYTKVC